MPVVSNESVTKEKLPFVAKCDKYRCYYRTAHKTPEEAQNILDTHKCPYSVQPAHIMNHFDERGRPYTVLHHAPTVGEQLWPVLDAAVKDLMVHGADDYRKGYARACADTLYKFVGIHYEDTDAIVREAVRRYRFETDPSIPFQATPGMDWNPPPKGSEAYKAAQRAMTGNPGKDTALGEEQAAKAVESRPASTRRSKPKQTKLIEPHFDQDTIDGIKHAVGMGFDKAELAGMYKTTVEHIDRVSQS